MEEKLVALLKVGLDPRTNSNEADNAIKLFRKKIGPEELIAFLANPGHSTDRMELIQLNHIHYTWTQTTIAWLYRTSDAIGITNVRIELKPNPTNAHLASRTAIVVMGNITSLEVLNKLHISVEELVRQINGGTPAAPAYQEPMSATEFKKRYNPSPKEESTYATADKVPEKPKHESSKPDSWLKKLIDRIFDFILAPTKT